MTKFQTINFRNFAIFITLIRYKIIVQHSVQSKNIILPLKFSYHLIREKKNEFLFNEMFDSLNLFIRIWFTTERKSQGWQWGTRSTPTVNVKYYGRPVNKYHLAMGQFKWFNFKLARKIRSKNIAQADNGWNTRQPRFLTLHAHVTALV